MKKFFLSVLQIVMVMAAFGQWSELVSPTTKNLYAVSFCDASNGIVAGESGALYLTTDGGITWAALTCEAEDFRSVCMVTPQLLLVGGSSLYRSEDGGATWTMPGIQAPKSFCFSDPLHGTCTGISGIYETTDGGINWIRVVQGGTSIYESISSFQNSSVAMGNVGGFVTYSAIGLRSLDGVWYPYNAFSFPNANAWVSVYYPNPDTAYLFLNQFNHWVPSDHNQFVRLTNFELVPDPFGELYWVFQSEVLNDAIPDYMQSVYFVDNNLGYACGENGSVFTTHNGGVDWVEDYSGNTMLWKMQFVNDAVAYAVGNSGLVIKHDLTTAVPQINSLATVSLFPNPASNNLTIMSPSPFTSIQLIDPQGHVAVSLLNDNKNLTAKVNTSTLTQGVYFVRLVLEDGKVLNDKIIVQ